METLVYFNGGDVCLGCYQRTKAAIEQLKARARKKGHTGYLIGHRYYDGQRDRFILDIRPDQKGMIVKVGWRQAMKDAANKKEAKHASISRDR